MFKGKHEHKHNEVRDERCNLKMEFLKVKNAMSKMKIHWLGLVAY
jgi:hypothetical protein